MLDKDLQDDPRQNPFYYWGLLSFVSGLLQITLMPFIAHYNFLFPSDEYFIIPAALLIFLTLILWQFTPQAAIYQAIVIGSGLIFYGGVQIFIACSTKIELNFGVFCLVIFLGILLVLSSYDLKLNQVKKSVDRLFLIVACSLSLVLMLGLLIKLIL